MKKPLIPLLILLASPLFACNSQKGASSKTYISYGSLYDQSATLISQAELDKKVANEESFLLAMSPGDEKDVHCSCWRTFSSIIDNFVKDHTPIVYKCSVWFAEKYGVTPPESEDPGFAVFENGKLKKQYVYTVKNTPTYFTNKDAFNSFINDITIAPKMIYIDDNQYQEKINENKRNIISYIRKGCSDCGYVLPNVFDPFFKKHETAQELYLLDIEDLGHYKTSTEEEKNAYQSYKDSLKLSESANAKYGYQKGVVPTTFVFENKEIIDANVFFNDSVSKKEDGTFYIFESYYSEERISNLKYTDVILKGKELKEDEVMDYNGFYYMPSSTASIYHTPILESFLNYYF